MTDKSEEALRREVVCEILSRAALPGYWSERYAEFGPVVEAFDALRDHYQARPTFEGDEAEVREWLPWIRDNCVSMPGNKAILDQALALLDAKDAEIEYQRELARCRKNGREVAKSERDEALARAERAEQESEEMQRLAKEEGVEEATQHIDRITGGDGEYRYSTLGGERHCPSVEVMQDRIAARFDGLRARAERAEQDLQVTGTQYHALVAKLEQAEQALADRNAAIVGLMDCLIETEGTPRVEALHGKRLDAAYDAATTFLPVPEPVDPLVECLEQALMTDTKDGTCKLAVNLRAALAARGGKIVFEGECS